MLDEDGGASALDELVNAKLDEEAPTLEDWICAADEVLEYIPTEDEDATTATLDDPVAHTELELHVEDKEMIVSRKLVLAIGPTGPIGSPGVLYVGSVVYRELSLVMIGGVGV